MPSNRTDGVFESKSRDGFETASCAGIDARGIYKRAPLFSVQALKRKHAQQYSASNMQMVNVTPANVTSMAHPKRVLGPLVMVMLFLTGTRAQPPTAGEYQVKAAFLYNFAKFVEWPSSSFPDASAPFRICVFGQDPFGQALLDITHEKIVSGHKLQVDQVVDVALARTCHILFIASSEKVQLKRIFESLQGTDVLTVGDIKGFAELGGIINFVLENDRVRFEVNRRAADRAGLKISSKLLGVAKLVIG